MQLILVRHSQTNYNVLGLCNSDPGVDVHLTEEGIAQTQRLAEKLRDVDFETVYVSELPRTRETAQILNQSHGSPMIVDPRLNDNATGYEGQAVEEWLAALEGVENRWQACFDGGESLEDAAARAVSFLEDLRSTEAETVLVVTHGFLTQAIFAAVESVSLAEASRYVLAQGSYALFSL